MRSGKRFLYFNFSCFISITVFFTCTFINSLPLYADAELIPLWRYAAGGELVSSPAVTDNGVYLYSEDRRIHAVSKDGDPLWKFRLPGRTVDSLAVGRDGTVYACTLDGRLFAVNRGGRELWRYDAEGIPAGPPAVSPDGTVYHALKNGELSAVSHRGFVRWKIDTGTGISGSPVVDAGEAVYFADDAGVVYSYTPWGSEQWRLSGPADAGGAGSMGSIGSAGSAGSDSAGWCAAIDAHVLYSACGVRLQAVLRGEILWEITLPSACAGIVINEGGLVCRLEDGSLQSYDRSGAYLWTAEGSGYESFPVAGGRRMFMISSGSLVSLDLDGAAEGRGRVDGVILTQPVMGGGLLVCGSEQWMACAFNVSDEAAEGWSQKGGGPAHSGFSGVGRWHFNEDEYKRNMDYLYLKQMITAGSVDDKLDAIEEIGTRIAADGIDRGERYLLHLLHLALSEGNIRQTVHTTPGASDFPAVRREAARMIGFYGSFESIELLTAVLAQERHYDVSAAIIRALGELGADYNNLVQITIYNKVIKDNNGNAYDGLALAAVDAIEKITAYTGSPGTGYGYMTLISINRGNYTAAVRKSAGEVLRSFR